jgi:hypothetical protein
METATLQRENSKDSKRNPIAVKFLQRRPQAHDFLLAYQWSTSLARDTVFLPHESVPRILSEAAVGVDAERYHSANKTLGPTLTE